MAESTKNDRTEQRLERFVRAARDTGIKLTHQRLEIFREIARSDEHPDVDSIFRRVRRRVPTISPDTVYRTFALLERSSELSKVSLFSDRARYDPNTERHHHFVCTECGRIEDFYSDELDRMDVPDRVREWGDVDQVYVELRGICNRCSG